MSCTWTYLNHRGLIYTWTYLDNRNLCCSFTCLYHMDLSYTWTWRHNRSLLLILDVPILHRHVLHLDLSAKQRPAPGRVWTRVRPFRLKIFFAYKRNKANLDPFHMCFTISL